MELNGPRKSDHPNIPFPKLARNPGSISRKFPRHVHTHTHSLKRSAHARSQVGEHLVDGALVDANVVRLDVHALDLATVDDNGVALAALVAQQRRRVKGHVELLCEGAGRVGQEANLCACARTTQGISVH